MASCRWYSFLLPWGWPLANNSPSQESGESHRQACMDLLCSEWIIIQTATRFSAAASSLSQRLHLFNLFDVLFFLKTHPDVLTTCSCEHDICWLLRRQAENRKELEHSTVDRGCNLCSRSTVHISLMLQKSKAEERLVLFFSLR